MRINRVKQRGEEEGVCGDKRRGGGKRKMGRKNYKGSEERGRVELTLGSARNLVKKA